MIFAMGFYFHRPFFLSPLVTLFFAIFVEIQFFSWLSAKGKKHGFFRRQKSLVQSTKRWRTPQSAPWRINTTLPTREESIQNAISSTGSTSMVRHWLHSSSSSQLSTRARGYMVDGDESDWEILLTVDDLFFFFCQTVQTKLRQSRLANVAGSSICLF